MHMSNSAYKEAEFRLSSQCSVMFDVIILWYLEVFSSLFFLPEIICENSNRFVWHFECCDNEAFEINGEKKSAQYNQFEKNEQLKWIEHTYNSGGFDWIVVAYCWKNGWEKTNWHWWQLKRNASIQFEWKIFFQSFCRCCNRYIKKKNAEKTKATAFLIEFYYSI